MVSWAQFQGVDFDWDLSDKTDTETQTRRGAIGDPHTGPADAIVQVHMMITWYPHLFVSYNISFFAFPDGPADRLPELKGRPLLQLWGESSRAEKIFGKSDALGAQG